MTARIDVMQAVNTPRVAADHGYAELVQGGLISKLLYVWRTALTR